jgi:hypothetical protein
MPLRKLSKKDNLAWFEEYKLKNKLSSMHKFKFFDHDFGHYQIYYFQMMDELLKEDLKHQSDIKKELRKIDGNSYLIYRFFESIAEKYAYENFINSYDYIKTGDLSCFI